MGWLGRPTQKKLTIPLRQDEVQQLPTPPQTSGETGNGSNEPHQDELRPAIQSNPRTLPPNVELRACKKEDIKSFKRLNSLLLPIPYGDAFYREILEDEVTRNITLMALWHDNPNDTTTSTEKGTLVGAIRCRLLTTLPGAPSFTQRREGPMLYLSTLVLLSPYRGHGIAAKMLDVLTRRAVNDYGIASIGAHVSEANAEGLAWYRKRGFKEVGREEGYYRRLDPQGAMVMRKEVGVMDLLGPDER